MEEILLTYPCACTIRYHAASLSLEHAKFAREQHQTVGYLQMASADDTAGVTCCMIGSYRCADGDLAKERGAVLEEWRSGRDSVGRTHEAHWKILLENTKVTACPGHTQPSSANVFCLLKGA